jgi:CubicO group peptidase (beta-lactamase class C family)
MQNQTKELNWYTYSLNVPMVTAPGDTIVYCSIEPNLALGMLQKVAREPLQEMFYRLVAKPMQLSNYHLFLTPMADMYGGGGHRFTSRDMMKLAQLMLNEGKWRGKPIVSRDWALKSGAALRTIWQNQQYGWLWNSIEYPWNGKKVRAVFAAGNGGQLFYAFPDLDLVIGFTAGNYNDRAAGAPAQTYVPQYLLPAVMP